MDCVCEKCGRKYPLDRAKGHRKRVCNSCHVSKRRKEREDKIYLYKGDKCVICGYSKSRRALHCHHKNPTEKDFQISGNWGLSWSKIQKELDKCILVCSNCHAEIHDGLIDIMGY